jgi:DNA-binding response OmpR family regulator
MDSIKDIKNSLFGNEPDKKGNKKNEKVILIVDDNPLILETLCSILKENFNLICCSTYKEVRELLTSKVKVVILDIKMLGIDGITIFKELKKFNKNLYIVFHSAYPGGAAQAEEADKLEHDGYIVKGEYSSRELIAKLNKLIKE